MKKFYRIVAKEMRTRSLVTIAMPDGTRMPSANPKFMPDGLSAAALGIAAREAVTSVPFTIVANESEDEVFRFGRPYITATSFRSTLRHIGFDLITEGMPAGSLSAHVTGALLVGGKIENKVSKAKKAPTSGKQTLAQHINRDFGVPLFSLFGFNNPTFLKGFDSFDMLLSKGKFVLTRSGIVRQPPGYQSPHVLDLMDAVDFAAAKVAAVEESEAVKKKDAAATKAKELQKNARKAKAEGRDDADEAAEQADEAREQADAADKNREVAMGQIHGKWYIPVGVDFSFQLTHRMSNSELGLLLAIIDKFGAQPFIGGDRGRGAGGNFSFDFEVQEWDDKTGYSEMGHICNNNPNGDVEIDDKLMPFINEFQANLGEYQEILRGLKG